MTTFFFNAIHAKGIDAKKTAVSFYKKTINFIQLHEYSTKIARSLTETLGSEYKILNPDGDLVLAVCLPPSEKLIVIIFAILKMGGAYLPLDPDFPEDTLLDIITKTRPVMLITDKGGSIVSKYGTENFSVDCQLITLEDIWLEVEIPRQASVIPQEIPKKKPDKIVSALEIADKQVSLLERPAVIIITTGISKDPRGVRIAHSAIMNRISWTWENLPYSKDGTCCLTVPLSFVESINQVFGPLLKGVTLHILKLQDVSNMSAFIKRIGELKITRINLSARVLDSFLDECQRMGEDDARTALRYLKFVNCKAEIIPLEIAERFFKIFPSDNKRLCSLYGFAEVSGDIICEKLNNLKKLNKRLIQGRVLVGKLIEKF